jgi:cytochrome oxidase Cu insertion factor (SCO1/SenC/PrrC family)
MKNRRKFIAALATSLPFLATAANKSNNKAFKSCPSNIKGPMSDRFGQFIVMDQNKHKSWFYEELIHEKLVLVNFTSVRGEKHYPIIDNLVKVQAMLEDRLGKDVYMYTIGTNPREDTPEKLKKLAESKGAKWKFLTGEPEDIRKLLLAFGIRGSISGLSWIGNEKTGRWMTKASRQHPLFIAEAVARLSTGKAHKPFLVDLRSV